VSSGGGSVVGMGIEEEIGSSAISETSSGNCLKMRSCYEGNQGSMIEPDRWGSGKEGCWSNFNIFGKFCRNI